jgi:hypothetical protein
VAEARVPSRSDGSSGEETDHGGQRPGTPVRPLPCGRPLLGKTHHLGDLLRRDPLRPARSGQILQQPGEAVCFVAVQPERDRRVRDPERFADLAARHSSGGGKDDPGALTRPRLGSAGPREPLEFNSIPLAHLYDSFGSVHVRQHSTSNARAQHTS